MVGKCCCKSAIYVYQEEMLVMGAEEHHETVLAIADMLATEAARRRSVRRLIQCSL